MPKIIQNTDLPTIAAIAVRFIAILFVFSILFSITFEFVKALNWEQTGYQEIPNAWYPMTTDWRLTWGYDIPQAIIASILWLAPRPIARRCITRATPNACPHCDYPKDNLKTNQCPECGQPWNTKDQPMNKNTLDNVEVFTLTATALRLLAVYFFALAIISLGNILIRSIGTDFSIMDTLQSIWWDFTDIRSLDSTIWHYVFPKLTIAITLWLFNKRIARWIIPNSP
jgi:hypothetical protein